MDNTALVQPEIVPTTRKSKKGLIIAVVISSIVLITVSIIIVIILSRSNLNTSQVQNDTNSTQTVASYTNSQEINTQTNQFSGQYINATLPTNWTIVEYTTELGMKYAIEDSSITYTGLTGMEVLDENDQVVFSFKGVDGIGGSGGCTEVARFSDTQQSYIQQIITNTQEVGMDPTTVIDYTNTTYSQINFAGKSFRRIGNKIFVNLSNSETYFNPGCGISRNIISVTKYKFAINDSDVSQLAVPYYFKINEAITEEATLLKLDEVLNSIV